MTAPPPSSPARRPLPALVFLLALCLLAALVWWRVLNRQTTTHASATPTCTPQAASPSTLPEPQAVTVLVVNSTTRQGLAGTVRTALLKDGFRIPGQATNDSPSVGGHGKAVAGVAEIRYGDTGAQGAELLAYYFPGATLAHTTSTDPTVVVAVGLAYRALRSQADVLAQLRANNITLVPAGRGPTTTASPGC